MWQSSLGFSTLMIVRDVQNVGFHPRDIGCSKLSSHSQRPASVTYFGGNVSSNNRKQHERRSYGELTWGQISALTSYMSTKVRTFRRHILFLSGTKTMPNSFLPGGFRGPPNNPKRQKPAPRSKQHLEILRQLKLSKLLFNIRGFSRHPPHTLKTCLSAARFRPFVKRSFPPLMITIQQLFLRFLICFHRISSWSAQTRVRGSGTITPS